MIEAPLPVSFFERPTLEVAPDLLGTLLVHEVSPEQRLVGRIVETEAYTEDDPACHAWRARLPEGPPQGRGAELFGPPGLSYVYLNYGIHWLFNVVTEPAGCAGGVLIRGVEPLEGRSYMEKRRPHIRRVRDLTNGPGKLSMAFGIDGRHHRQRLDAPPLYLARSRRPGPVNRVTSTRIGISRAVDRPWRFFEAGNRFVSPGKPAGG